LELELTKTDSRCLYW